VGKERVAPGVYKVAAGTYDLTVSTGRGLDGKYGQATKRVRGTLNEAKAERGRMLAEVRDGKLDGTTDITMTELHARFMAAKPMLAPSSVELYGYLWKKLEPHIGAILVRKLKAVDLDRAYTAIIKTGIGPNTVKKAHKHVVGMLTQAMRWELLHRNVAHSATPPTTVPFEVRPPGDDDLVRLVAGAFKQERQFGALVHLGITTGARRGELAGLRWCDVDLDNAVVRFEHQPGKDGELRPLKSKKGRSVFIDAETVEMLTVHKAYTEAIAEDCGGTIHDECFVFSNDPGNTAPYNLVGLSKRFMRLARNTGVKSRLHDLRHSAATRLLASGVPPQVVAARLGHSSPTITMAIYAHTDVVQDRRAADLGALTRP